MFKGGMLFLEGIEQEGEWRLKMFEIESHGEEFLDIEIEV